MVRATAIWNQDSIVELLTRELARTTREGGDLCVMLAGIDPPTPGRRDGQPASDPLLSEIAKRFSALLRPYDHVGHFGTDQLLIVVSGCNLASMLPVAEKLRQSVAQTPIEAAGAKLTVSLALADGSFHSEEELLRELGGLLYRAQAKGGNRVESAKKLAAPPRLPNQRRIRLPLLLGGAVVAALVVLYFVAPSTLCTPFLLRDIFSSNELPPPLPSDCASTAEHPSEATLRSLDSQRESRGLILEGTITCKINSSGPKDRSAQIDQQWLDTIYVNGTMQYKRNVLLATSESVKGGTLFTVEQSVMPWWTYITQPQDRCWEQAEFWK
jgi:diguanylate cyclase (GGDEF)-like protein